MRVPRTSLLLLAALLAVVGSCLPSAAVAAPGTPSAGVHVDPSSPVAKEYALPLATARGAPADTGSVGSLFGRGITRTNRRPPGRATTTTQSSHALPAETTIPAPDTAAPTNRPRAHEPAANRRAARRHHREAPTRSGMPARLSHPAESSRTGALTDKTAPTPSQILHPEPGPSWFWLLLAALAVLAAGAGGTFLLVRARARVPKPH